MIPIHTAWSHVTSPEIQVRSLRTSECAQLSKFTPWTRLEKDKPSPLNKRSFSSRLHAGTDLWVEQLLGVDDPRVQSGTSPCFYISMSRFMSPMRKKLLLFKAPHVGSTSWVNVSSPCVGCILDLRTLWGKLLAKITVRGKLYGFCLFGENALLPSQKCRPIYFDKMPFFKMPFFKRAFL